jgi:RNA polymerase sigma factor (sigma-70 family)
MTDEQLLECFVTCRDEAAFETLVRRYGPMVLGVCRRVLGNPHDAEDAFQATFLVLVRKANSIGQRDLLGNWLYGVAYRTALDARAAALRRQTRERPVDPLPEPAVEVNLDLCRDVRPLLDEELNRLPVQYRLPVILCYLEGRTFRDAAQQLGIPTGTLSGRLSTARGMLARRLARHGVTLSLGVLTAALSPGVASAGVPPPLITATVDAGMAAVGQGAARAISANIAALAEGVLNAMWVKSQKITAALLLSVGIVLGVATVLALADRTTQDERVKILPLQDRGRSVTWSPDGKTLVVVTKVEKTFLGIQYYGKGSAIRLWDVETGKVKQTLARDSEGGLAFQRVVFSGDGKTIAATVSEEVIKPNVRMIRDVIKLWDAETTTLKQTLECDSHQLAGLTLSPDGSLAAAGDPGKKSIKLWNTATGKLERTLDAETTRPWFLAFSPDGKTLVVGGQNADHRGDIQLWDAQTWKRKHVMKQDKYVNTVAFSPDGKMVAGATGGRVIRIWSVEKGELIASLNGHPHGHRTVAFSADSKMVAAGGPDGRIRLWDVKTGEEKEIMQGHEDQVYSIAFSPDGKTLASTGQDQTLRLWKMDR